ncbi:MULTISPECIES: hypothetical protein [Bacillaceae]|uniref:Phage tail protein n=1 Tax=Evansella alkalicola TaxID=745819 RepID=A0ABS6K251_9BACI|nr:MULTISPECIES: hypothetical protein [Bacillaceae]MBU9724124.1 hypothetical protein [Bacillus alkalicola]
MRNRKAVAKPQSTQLGEGVLIYNFNPDDWNDEESVAFGATRGGGSYNVEPTNKPIRFDGDNGEDTKGLKRREEWKITITANALEFDHEKMQRYMPGTTETKNQDIHNPAYTKYRPKVDFDDEDYFENLAYVTQTKSGDVVAYVIENVLPDGAFSAAFNDKDEVVAETTFTAHFDPEKMNEVPTYIVYYEGLSLNEEDQQ